ncbi:hypothetical protein AAG906_001388 [Vitis piasezkii]
MNPLSPYLFVVAMEVLSCLLKRAKDWYPLGVRHVEKLTFELGCNVGGLSSTYMGLSLEEHFLNKSLVANMRKMELSSLVVQETDMRPSYRKLLGNIGTLFIVDLPLCGLGNRMMKSNRLEGVVIDGEEEDKDKMAWMDSRSVFSKVKFSLRRVPENSKVKHIEDDRESVKILRLVVKLFAFRAGLRVSSSQRVNQWHVGDEDAFFGNIRKLA